MRLEHKQALEEYAKIKKEINILDNKAEEMKVQVLAILQENDLGEVEIGLDKISIGSRRSWVYPENIKIAEKELRVRATRNCNLQRKLLSYLY